MTYDHDQYNEKALTFKDVRDLILKIVELKGSEKSQGAKVEGHNRWHTLLFGQKQNEAIIQVRLLQTFHNLMLVIHLLFSINRSK